MICMGNVLHALKGIGGEGSHLRLGVTSVRREGALPQGRAHRARPVSAGNWAQPPTVQCAEVAWQATDALLG